MYTGMSKMLIVKYITGVNQWTCVLNNLLMAYQDFIDMHKKSED